MRYKWVYKIGNREKAIKGIQKVTSFFTHNITGYYYSAGLENFLDKIADQNLQKPTDRPFINQAAPKNIYHVFTEAYAIGGHTRLATNWIRIDAANRHYVILVNQKVELPVILQDLVANDKVCGLVQLDNKLPALEAAQQLRNSLQQADLVINHTHPNDVIFYLAISDPGGRPVLHMNHADHISWLGNHVDDLLATYRENTIQKEKRNRGIDNVQFLPILLKENPSAISRMEARNRLNISSEQIMLLTIAGGHKFTPCFQWNYFSDMITMLNKYPNAILYIIGISNDTVFAKKYVHPRIIYCGYLDHTALHESAADVYVESYPFPSFTSFLQASLKGIACQLNYAPVNLSRLFNDNEAFTYPANWNDWDSGLSKLITDAAYRKEMAEKQSGYVYRHYCDENNWRSKLGNIYKETTPLPITSKRSRKARFSYNMDEKLKFKVMNKYSLIDPLRILFLK